MISFVIPIRSILDLDSCWRLVGTITSVQIYLLKLLRSISWCYFFQTVHFVLRPEVSLFFLHFHF